MLDAIVNSKYDDDVADTKPAVDSGGAGAGGPGSMSERDAALMKAFSATPRRSRRPSNMSFGGLLDGASDGGGSSGTTP